LSRRQIERLFKRDLNCVPKRYYLEMRLRRARELLLQTAMPIMDITAACGFQSPPHFSKCYRINSAIRRAPERKIGVQLQLKYGANGSRSFTYGR
jgi:transcriptional regulator GlxA family with amidase domain